MLPCAVDDVGLDYQVVTNEFSRVCVVGMGATNPCCCQYDIFEFGMGAQDKVVVTLGDKAAQQG